MIRPAALLIMLLFLFDSCAKQQTQQSSSSDKNTVGTDFRGNVSLSAGVTPVSVGNASDFYWYNSKGEKNSLGDLKGKTVLINFWATWCGPCKAELPDLENLSKAYSSRGLVVVGVSVDRGENLLTDVSEFASRTGLTYQIVIDKDDIAGAYGNINAIPTSFLIGKNGKVIDKWIGMRDKAFFESTIKRYLD